MDSRFRGNDKGLFSQQELNKGAWMRNPEAKFVWGILICLFLPTVGCNQNWRKDNSAQIEREKLLQQNHKLEQESARQRQQIAQLEQELTTLRDFPSDRLKHLVYVEEIEFGRYTRAYDDNDDGTDDGVMVYLVLHDRRGDRIKASGMVEIELWDLAAEPNRRHLLGWAIPDIDLWDHWFGGALANHYKFKIPWKMLMESKKPAHDNLTLKLRFIDALTGRTFEIQKMLEIRK
jgi:hypothetical protein